MWSSWITVSITAFAMFLVATIPLLFLEPQSIASITFVCVIVPLFTALASFLHWKMFTSTFRELADGIESARTDLQRKEGGGGGKRRVLTGADGTTAAIDVSTTTPQKKRVTANAAHSDIFRLEATVRDVLVGLSESASSPSRYSSNTHRMQFSSHASSRSGRVDTTAAALDFDELPLEDEAQEEGEEDNINRTQPFVEDGSQERIDPLAHVGRFSLTDEVEDSNRYPSLSRSQHHPESHSTPFVDSLANSVTTPPSLPELPQPPNQHRKPAAFEESTTTHKTVPPAHHQTNVNTSLCNKIRKRKPNHPQNQRAHPLFQDFITKRFTSPHVLGLRNEGGRALPPDSTTGSSPICLLATTNLDDLIVVYRAKVLRPLVAIPTTMVASNNPSRSPTCPSSPPSFATTLASHSNGGGGGAFHLTTPLELSGFNPDTGKETSVCFMLKRNVFGFNVTRHDTDDESEELGLELAGLPSRILDQLELRVKLFDPAMLLPGRADGGNATKEDEDDVASTAMESSIASSAVVPVVPAATDPTSTTPGSVPFVEGTVNGVRCWITRLHFELQRGFFLSYSVKSVEVYGFRAVVHGSSGSSSTSSSVGGEKVSEKFIM